MKIFSRLLGLALALGVAGHAWAQTPGVNEAVNAQTGTTYTVSCAPPDAGKLVTTSNASAIAVTLPQAGLTCFGAGWWADFQNRGAGTVTITPATSTVDGASTYALTQNQGVRLVSDGTNYFTQRGSAAGGGGGGPVTVANGGTGLASGTSGGVLGFTGSTTIASSAALAVNGVVIGGGAGATPTAITAGTNNQILIGNTSAAPTFSTGVPAQGGFTASPRNFSTCGVSATGASSQFTSQTPVATEVYISEIFIPANVSVTGIAVLNTATLSGNLKVGLANSSGVNVATSASTAASGTSVYQLVPFTAPYAAVGPATYYVETFYDNNTIRPNALAVGSCGASKQTGQTYATGFTTITPPTTFTANLGPVANLY